MKSLSAIIFKSFLLISLLPLKSEAVKKKLVKEIHVCKKSHPQLSKCYCENFNRMIPLLKNAIPEMGTPSLEPFHVERIKMLFPETQNFNFNAVLQNVSLEGLINGKAECEAAVTENGVQVSLDINFANILLRSNYYVKGTFVLINLDTHGDFHGVLTEIRTKSIWNSTRYMKNDKEYLTYTIGNIDLDIKKIQMYFNNIFGNNTELNDNINETINSNINFLYREIRPVILATIREVLLQFCNGFHDLFPYDVLYPNQ